MTTNEILTRAAEVLERSVTLENQTLAAELRRFDTAQREALARVEAEKAEVRLAFGGQQMTLDECQAQLAEAVGLLREVNSQRFTTAATVEIIESFIGRHSQTFHDHAQAEQQEAQGAQAVDERAAFEHWASDEGKWPKAVDRNGEFYKLAQTQSYWQAWMARAALATQPAAGEPVAMQARMPGCRWENYHKDDLAELVAAGMEVRWLYAAAPEAAGEPVAWRFQTCRGGQWHVTTNKMHARMFDGTEDGGLVQDLFAVAPPAAAHGDGLHFNTAEYLASAIRQVSAYEDLGPELIAEEMFKQAGANGAVHGDEAVHWVPCSERLPEVAQFDQQEFIVSVQRKDKVITMSALYLNAYPLYCEDHDDADDEGYVPHTGWYDAKSNGDDANCYTLVNDSWYGSTVTHWMPMPKPAAAMRAQAGEGEDHA